MLGLLGGAGDASSKGLEEVGGVGHGGGNGGCRLKAWNDVLPVDAGAPCHVFSIVRGDGEITLFHLSLVDSDAPKGEQFDMSIDNTLAKILIPAMLADVLLSSLPACEFLGEGGGQVLCKDCIAKEGGGEKGAETFEIRKAVACCRGSGEGGQIVDRQTVGDVLGRGNSHLDGAKGCLVVNNDRESRGSFPDKSSHFVRGTKEGSAKVVGVVEDGDLPCAVCHEKKIVGLVELCHFQLGGCFEVHRASETGNVWFPDSLTVVGELKRAFQEVWRVIVLFISIKLLRLRMASASTMTRRCSRIMTKGSLQGILAIC